MLVPRQMSSVRPRRRTTVSLRLQRLDRIDARGGLCRAPRSGGGDDRQADGRTDERRRIERRDAMHEPLEKLDASSGERHADDDARGRN